MSLLLTRRTAVAAGAFAASSMLSVSAAFAQADDVGMGPTVAALFEPTATPALREAFWRERLSAGGQGRTPLEVFQAQAEAIAARTGGVDLLETSPRPGQLRLHLRARRLGVSRWIRVRMDRDAPDRVLDIAANPSPRPYDREGPAGPVSRAELAAEIARRVAFGAETDDFSGAVMVVAPDGEPVWQGAVGLADREAGRASTVRTPFHLGSADKSFTALMIGRLVSEGRLGFDTLLIDVLPDYPNRTFAEACTIDHLLTHASGLGGLFERPNWDKRAPFTRMADLLPAFAAEAPAFTPGTGQGYSNEGYVVLGAVLEAVTGRSWYDLLAQQVYAPAEMTASGHLRADEARDVKAVGYRFPDDDQLGLDQRRRNDDALGYRGNSCGGGYSTVGDMTRYLRALRSGRILPSGAVASLTARQPGGLANYGRGFFVRPIANRTTVGHGGGGPHSGIDGDHAIIWETGWSVSVLGNYDAPFGGEVARDITRWLAVQDA